MTDYIDRQAAIDALEEYADRLQMVDWKENPGVPYKAYALNWCINTIRDLPPAEVEPVKRGKWINDKGLYRCSECNELWTKWWANVVPIERMNKMMKYCPNCGAKMEPISASPENGQE